MSEDYRKYLELVQGVVTRLASNSFSIKGWRVALVAVLGGLAAKDADPRFAFCLWLPTICFWGLDAFYRRQERLFRALYDDVISAETHVVPYSMEVGRYQAQGPSVRRIAFSRTVLWLHLAIAVFVLTLSAYSIVKSISGHPTVSRLKPVFQPSSRPSRMFLLLTIADNVRIHLVKASCQSVLVVAQF